MQISAGKLGAEALRRALTDEPKKKGGPPRERWAYRAVSLLWDEERQAYTADFSDTGRVTGISAVLSRYGDQGWELVSFGPNRWAGGRVTEYYAVFKRRE